ncbi:MAG TPA: class I SAM-dependent methyltransferase [Actinomycetota bacterium]|nr:class I SAM-dependent methyltransferase [Actinomycetota bacterium]
MPAPHVRKNRRFWDRFASEYQALHGERLAATARAWGIWRIPDDEIGALGALGGKDVLELGCGAAQWSAGAAEAGGRPTGIDLSARQLRHARRRLNKNDVSIPLVQGSAEELPFRDESFDVVISDHGAISFADPARTIPEAARVLRPGGTLAFCIGSPFMFISWNPKTERVDRRLHGEYFAMRSADDETSIQFQLPYGEWIDLFAGSGLEVRRLMHLRPPDGATTTYKDYAPRDWARRWPAEDLWVVAKPNHRRR